METAHSLLSAMPLLFGSGHTALSLGVGSSLAHLSLKAQVSAAWQLAFLASEAKNSDLVASAESKFSSPAAMDWLETVMSTIGVLLDPTHHSRHADSAEPEPDNILLCSRTIIMCRLLLRGNPLQQAVHRNASLCSKIVDLLVDRAVPQLVQRVEPAGSGSTLAANEAAWLGLRNAATVLALFPEQVRKHLEQQPGALVVLANHMLDALPTECPDTVPPPCFYGCWDTPLRLLGLGATQHSAASAAVRHLAKLTDLLENADPSGVARVFQSLMTLLDLAEFGNSGESGIEQLAPLLAAVDCAMRLAVRLYTWQQGAASSQHGEDISQQAPVLGPGMPSVDGCIAFWNKCFRLAERCVSSQSGPGQPPASAAGQLAAAAPAARTMHARSMRIVHFGAAHGDADVVELCVPVCHRTAELAYNLQMLAAKHASGDMAEQMQRKLMAVLAAHAEAMAAVHALRVCRQQAQQLQVEQQQAQHGQAIDAWALSVFWAGTKAQAGVLCGTPLPSLMRDAADVLLAAVQAGKLSEVCSVVEAAVAGAQPSALCALIEGGVLAKLLSAAASGGEAAEQRKLRALVGALKRLTDAPEHAAGIQGIGSSSSSSSGGESCATRHPMAATFAELCQALIASFEALPCTEGVSAEVHRLEVMRCLSAAAKIAAQLQRWQEEEAAERGRAAAAEAVALAAATRSCANLRCLALALQGGPDAGQGVKCKRCSGCRHTWYCSVECQRTDWRAMRHKQVCTVGIERQEASAACVQDAAAAAALAKVGLPENVLAALTEAAVEQGTTPVLLAIDAISKHLDI